MRGSPDDLFYYCWTMVVTKDIGLDRSSRDSGLRLAALPFVIGWATAKTSARKHYFQTTEDYFARAANDEFNVKQNPKQRAAVSIRGDLQSA